MLTPKSGVGGAVGGGFDPPVVAASADPASGGPAGARTSGLSVRG
jgi:hypothetical protein